MAPDDGDHETTIVLHEVAVAVKPVGIGGIVPHAGVVALWQLVNKELPAIFDALTL